MIDCRCVIQAYQFEWLRLIPSSGPAKSSTWVVIWYAHEHIACGF